MPLPIGFFMPLPLPIMIPFMMWQSAAIAAGFGTYFQFAKRRVSAMSNEEFNSADPHELVNSMYSDIVKQIPSSFAKVDSLTPVMLQSMNTMLDQAVKWLQGAITGNIFGTPNPVNPLNDPELPLEPSLELLSPSAESIHEWNNTKLFDVFHNKLHLYSSSAQDIIKLLFGIRFQGSKDKPPEPSAPTIPLNELTPSGIFVFKQSDLPDSSHLLIKRLNELVAEKSWSIISRMLNNIWTSAVNQIENGRSQTVKDLGARTKLAVGILIVAYNKWSQANL